MYFGTFPILIRLVFRSGFTKFSLFGLVVLVMGSLISSVFSGRQPATVGLDVGFSLIRIILPFAVALMAQELLGREFERRYYLFSLTYPSSLICYLLARFIVMTGLAVIFLAVMAGLLWLVVYFVNKGYSQASPVDLSWKYTVVLAGIFIEILVVIAVAQFFSVVSLNYTFVVVGVLGFTLIGRSYMSVVSLISLDGSVVGGSESYSVGVGVLRYMIPDLGGLDFREIALYDQWGLLSEDWMLTVVASIVYALAFFALGVITLKYKRFD